MDENEGAVLPPDLSTLSDEEVQALEARVVEEFDRLADDKNIDAPGVEKLNALAGQLESLRAESESRVAAAAERQVKAQSARDRVAAVRKPVEAPAPVPTAAPEPPVESEEAEEPAETTPVVAGARPKSSLAAAQARAPQIPEPSRPSLMITATAPTSGVQIGSPFGDVDALVAAVQSHAKGLVTTHGTPSFVTVATMANEYPEVMDDRMAPKEFEAMARRLKTDDQLDAIVAGGGWCAPSEIRYDFFNIACQDGMIDLPTFGVTRGGINHPVSPSLADVFTGSFTSATNPWLWTETDDIATVTGSPNKPCVRVMCPTFTDRRLECYGICLTAGNLTDAAYPEATRNHLSLLMAAHYHAMNQRYIQTMVSLSTAVTSISGSGNSIAADLPDAVAIAANDYRTKYGMCDDDVLEVVVPRWVKDAIRGDLARRSGDVGYLTMSDADINALFRLRRVRVQWVADWQIRGAGQFGQTAPLAGWPGSVDFMVYAAGTFMRGNGMSLDLGIVRDSILNAENDHTAAWSEECHLIARYGHESRQYRLPVCVGGKTGGTFTTCATA